MAWPFLICLVLSAFYALQGNSILSNLVQDKETKLRETIRIMGISRIAYSMSYVVSHGIVSIFTAAVFSMFVCLNGWMFPNDNAGAFFVLMILTAFGTLTFSMALSAFFSDAKLASQVGSILLFLPVTLFFNAANGSTVAP